MGELNPTTKAQVSGHKFLKRRVEHGLILGDIRMIHDPLARRKRALTFGVAGAALIGVGAGAMALFAPQANPGDATIIAAESGQLFVRVDETYHPVSNLASARLVGGQPEEPAKADDDILALMPKSVPVGIIDAPSIIGDQSTLPDLAWFACHVPSKRTNRLDQTPDKVVFVVDDEGSRRNFNSSNEVDSALIARVDNNGLDADYLITQSGRMKLPPADSIEGRIVRRELGVEANAALWTPPADVVSAIKELPEFSPPPKEATIWATDRGYWLHHQEKVAPISEIQYRILTSMGHIEEPKTLTEVHQLHDLDQPMAMPDRDIELKDPTATTVCVDEHGSVTAIAPEAVQEPAALGGESIATHFAGPGRSIAVDTGSGTHLIAETGLRHQIAGESDKAALGITHTQDIPWLLLRLLPEGTALSRDNASRPLY